MKAKLAKKVKHELSAPVYLESDLLRMKEYQLSLVNLMLYHNPFPAKDAKNGRWASILLDEIQKVEVWLKRHYELFVNNNLRKFEAA